MTTAVGDFYERAYDYFLAEIYDEWYVELSDKSKGPFRPVAALMATFEELNSQDPSSIRILDCACGTGSLFAFLSDAGYDAWASDGSPQMLGRALENCTRLPENQRNKLFRTPIRWTDRRAFEQVRERAGLFDIITIATNSFCHLPSTSKYMDVALRNFVDILKPGGRVLIDTKRYIQAAPVNGVPMFQELRFVESSKERIIRFEREESRKIKKRKINFHTRLHYDVDPSVNLCRALIVITRYGRGEAPQTMVLPYYPLPARILEERMRDMDLQVSIVPARQPPVDWSYDFVIGHKR